MLDSDFRTWINLIKVQRATEATIHSAGGTELACPTCERRLIGNLTFEDFEKLSTWSLAQLISFLQLVERSGITAKDLLQTASTGEGHVAVPNFHGMYIGIERDGYTHS